MGSVQPYIVGSEWCSAQRIAVWCTAMGAIAWLALKPSLTSSAIGKALCEVRPDASNQPGLQGGMPQQEGIHLYDQPSGWLGQECLAGEEATIF